MSVSWPGSLRNVDTMDRADNGSVGHGSNESTNPDGSRGSVPVTR